MSLFDRYVEARDRGDHKAAVSWLGQWLLAEGHREIVDLEAVELAAIEAGHAKVVFTG